MFTAVSILYSIELIMLSFEKLNWEALLSPHAALRREQKEHLAEDLSVKVSKKFELWLTLKQLSLFKG